MNKRSKMLKIKTKILKKSKKKEKRAKKKKKPTWGRCRKQTTKPFDNCERLQHRSAFLNAHTDVRIKVSKILLFPYK